MAGQTESVWWGRPPLTWFLDHLGQVKKITQRHYTTFPIAAHCDKADGGYDFSV